jgi:alkanesulfonate monooxygenase SsuD/methylene tetrahydromethanopterin reductase-like flavin-dependent oxidoreductase (luciferase family)
MSFRRPALLAKMAVSADLVSGGRLVLGVGAGWYDREYLAFGYPLDHRVGRLDEALQVVCPLLDGETVPFDGRWEHVHGAALLPPPERRIPVLVAGTGPRMLRLTARYGDAWNTAWYGHPGARVRAQLADFDAALEAERRERSAVRRTVGVIVREGARRGEDDAVGSDPREIADALDAYEALCVDDVIALPEPMERRLLDRLGEAIAARA